MQPQMPVVPEVDFEAPVEDRTDRLVGARVRVTGRARRFGPAAEGDGVTGNEDGGFGGVGHGKGDQGERTC